MSDKGFRFRWERALRGSELNKAARAVGFVMGTYSNMDGTKVHPGIDQLAAGSAYGDRQTRAAVKSLESAGFVSLVKAGNSLRGEANEYRLTIPSPHPGGNPRQDHRQITTPLPAKDDTEACRGLPTTRSSPDQDQTRTNAETAAAVSEDEIQALIATAPSFHDDEPQQDLASIEAALAETRPQRPVDPLRSSPPRIPHPKDAIYARNSLEQEGREQKFDPNTGEYLDRETRSSGYRRR